MSGKEAGAHAVTLTFPAATAIGCIQVASGWLADAQWTSPVSDFVLEYHDGTVWKELPGGNVSGNKGAAFSLTLSAPVGPRVETVGTKRAILLHVRRVLSRLRRD